MSRFQHINYWPKEDRIEENSLTEGSTSTDKSSIEDLNLVKEDRIEEDSLTEGSTSTGESSTEDLNLVVNLVEDRTEENSLTEEVSSEESTSTGENSIEDLNLVDEQRIEEFSLMGEVSEEEYISTDDSRTEDLNLEETDLNEERENYFSKELGLVFRERNCFETEPLIVQIVAIGNEGCGKTELIKTVFECHSSFTVVNRPKRIEYRVFLSRSHIWIHDAKETEFVSQSNFVKNTVFLFCHDVDNPLSFANIEETWIPIVLEKSMKEMHYLLVSIKREPKTEPKAKRLKKEDRVMALRVKEKELNGQFRAGRIIECFIEDKHSLLNVFQSAIDYACPRFQFK